MFVASGAGSTGAAGDDMATANANAAPGATRPVDQHVEFVVKVILFCRRRNAGGMGQCASKRSLAVLYLPSRCVQYAHRVFAPFSQVSSLAAAGSDCPALGCFLSRAVGCSAVRAQDDASAWVSSAVRSHILQVLKT